MEAGEIGGRNDDDVSRRLWAVTAANSAASLSSMAISPSDAWVRGVLPGGTDAEPDDETETMFSDTETQLSR